MLKEKQVYNLSWPRACSDIFLYDNTYNFSIYFTDSGEDGRNSKIAEGINSYLWEGEDITGELK